MLPHTGEIVQLDDATACAHALDELRYVTARIHAAKRLLTHALAARAELLGTRTLDLGAGASATVTGGAGRQIDPDMLADGLREAGMPDERIDEIVVTTVTRSVDVRQADRAARANAAYKAALDAATTDIEKPWSVSVRGLPGRMQP